MIIVRTGKFYPDIFKGLRPRKESGWTVRLWRRRRLQPGCIETPGITDYSLAGNSSNTSELVTLLEGVCPSLCPLDVTTGAPPFSRRRWGVLLQSLSANVIDYVWKVIVALLHDPHWRDTNEGEISSMIWRAFRSASDLLALR